MRTTRDPTSTAALTFLGAVDTVTGSRFLVETADSAGSFSTLVTALKAAGLDRTLAGPGPFTVFAPTDEAFAKIPKADLDALLADKDKLTAVLTYHVVAGKVLAAGGFDPSSLATPIAEWPVADTRDETPEQWALRVTDVALIGDALTITITDPGLRDRIAAALSSDDLDVRERFGRIIRDL